MRTDKYRHIRQLVILIGLVLISRGIDFAEAANFCVTSSSQLQAALGAAADNGEADEIQIAQGNYLGNFTYQSQESYKLTIRGGYASDCASRVADPTNTVLLAGSAGSVLTVDMEGGADVECEGITFRNGSAQQGGGLHITTIGNVTLSNNIVQGNRAAEFGGGMNITSNGTVTLSNNTIYQNQSDYYAGGAAIHAGTLIMTANVVRGNSAEGAAGGIWASGGSVSLINNLFYGNSAVWYHGATLIEGDAVKVINNTIAYNHAEGLGAGLTVKLNEDSDSAVIYNNIIYGNSGYYEGNDLAIFNDENENGTPSPVSLLNNDFDQSTAGTDITIPFSIDPSNLDNADPLFANTETSDYHLTQGSPCIDTGASTEAPSTDIEGTARPQGAGFDMGAYEYVGSPRPDIKANGQEGNLVVTPEEPISITIGLDAGNKAGSNADWWIVVRTPFASPGDWYSYVYPSGWQPGIHACVQMPLFNLSPVQVLYMSFPAGSYTFYFALDEPDGSPSGPWLGMDSVNIHVQ